MDVGGMVWSAAGCDVREARHCCVARPDRDFFKRERDFVSILVPLVDWVLGYNFGPATVGLGGARTPNRRDGPLGMERRRAAARGGQVSQESSLRRGWTPGSAGPAGGPAARYSGIGQGRSETLSRLRHGRSYNRHGIKAP